MSASRRRRLSYSEVPTTSRSTAIDAADALDRLRSEPYDLAVVVVGEHAAHTIELLREVTVDEDLRERRMIAYLPAKLSEHRPRAGSTRCRRPR